MQTLLFSAANGFISVCYFSIGLLMLIPFLRGEIKTPLVLATISIFFSCAFGHGAHAVLMSRAMHYMPTQALNVQIAADLTTAVIALIYIGLRRSYAFLIDGPLLLTQAQNQLTHANAELARMNAELELRVEARTAELTASNAQLAQEIRDRKLTEVHLQRSQELLRQVIDNIPQLIFWKDCNSVYQGCNQRFAKLVGFHSSDDVIGKTDEDMSWKSSLSETNRQLDRAVIESNEAKLHVITALTKTDNGTQHWIDVSKVPLHDANGQVIGVLESSEDITERMQAEAALAEREAQLRSINTVVPGVIYQFTLNLTTGEQHFTYVSPRAIELFEVEPAALYDISTFESLIHSDDLVHMQQSASVAMLNRTPWRAEFRIRTPSGKEKWIRGQSEPMESPNNMLVYSGIFVDLSERKHAEEALNQANSLLNSVIETMPYFFYAKDLEGKHIAINSNLASFFGRTITEIIGKSDAELLPIEVAEPIMAKDREVMTTGITARFEESVPTHGADCTYLSTKTPLYNSQGSIIGLVGISQDITTLKTAEAALQQSEAQLRQRTQDLEQALFKLQSTQSQLVQSEKMSSLGQLVAGIAHEINNPVSFIYGNLTPAVEYTQDLMHLLSLYQQHYPLPPIKIQKAIEMIDLDFVIQDLPRLLTSMEIGAERIQKIVLSLRNFSRMDEAEMKIVDLHEGIDSTLLILQSRLRATHNESAIEVEKDYGELPLIECYAGQLNQVFMNLLTNAIDALNARRKETESAKILIQTRHIAANIVSIEISDNGTGIPAEVQQRIFDPFFTTKPIGEGTGLGLSISYQVMQKHQGTLTCTSTPGQGTTFGIELPIQSISRQVAAHS